MSTDERIAVDCSNCGEVYRVMPPQVELRAKCRRCGSVMTVPATASTQLVVTRPVNPLSEEGRAAGALVVAKIAESHRRSRQRGGKKPALVAAGLLVLLAAVAWGSLGGARSPDAELREPEPVAIMPRSRVARLSKPSLEQGYQSVADLIEAVEPSVVQIKTSRGVGSGFIIDPAGLIATCHHCIEDVRFATAILPEGTALPVVGVRGTRSGRDLAIIEVRTSEPLAALPLTPTPPRKGEPIVSFGSPAGLAFTTSEGSVSAIRTAGEVHKASWVATRRMAAHLAADCRLVQFTASSMPGNSGGPIVDFHGNVVGVTSFGLRYQGWTYEFGIASEEIAALARDLNERPIPLMELVETNDRELADLIEDLD